MIKYYAVIILLFLQFLSFGQEKPKEYSDAIKLIEVWLDAQKDYENLPGIMASIVSDQKLIWSGAFGMANIEGNVKAKIKTLCSICSISKLFTSVAVMKLYDEEKLRLDDKIEDLLPWYDLEQQYSESGPITVRTLLSHSSGLPRENVFSHWNGPDYSFPTKDQIINTLSNQKTLYPASTYYQYSNLALTLLGFVVEEVSGESYDDYVKNNILSKLGLTDTQSTMPRSLHGNDLAIGYSPLSRDGKRKKVSFFQTNGVKAAAGFSSNVLDLGKFASWQFRLRDAKTTEILKSSTIKNMHNVHWTDPDWKVTRGLGFVVWKGPDGKKWVGHGGWCPGYKTTLQLNLNKKIAYSVMINAEGVNLGKYVKGLHGIINKVKSVKDNGPSNNTKDLSEYEGYYDFEMIEYYVTTWEGNIALVKLPTDLPAETMKLYKHIEGDKFQQIRNDDKLGDVVFFERNDEGKIYRMKQHGNWIFTKIKR